MQASSVSGSSCPSVVDGDGTVGAGKKGGGSPLSWCVVRVNIIRGLLQVLEFCAVLGAFLGCLEKGCCLVIGRLPVPTCARPDRFTFAGLGGVVSGRFAYSNEQWLP